MSLVTPKKRKQTLRLSPLANPIAIPAQGQIEIPPKSEIRKLNDFRLTIFFFLIGCCFSVAPIVNAAQHHLKNKDYRIWYGIGRIAAAGEPLYGVVQNGEPEYMYPPTAAVLFYAPLSILGPVGFVAVLCLVSAASWAYCVNASARLICGSSSTTRNYLAYLPGLTIAPYVWDIQLLGQANLFLLALTLGSFLSIREKQSTLASTLFGLAVSFKAFPLPAIAYAIVRRQWTTVVGSIISIVFFAWFAPGIIRGFERNTAELIQWASLMIADQSGNTMAGRSLIGFTRRNQSLVSVSHRLLRHIDAGEHHGNPVYVNFADVSPRVAQGLGHLSCMLLGLVLLIACRFRFAQNLECEGLEVAMVCTLVPLCSPLAWTYFFCWLLPAWTAIFYWIQNPRLSTRSRWITKTGMFVAGFLLASAVSEQIDPRLQAYGVTAFGAVSLFATLAFVRFTISNEALSIAK